MSMTRVISEASLLFLRQCGNEIDVHSGYRTVSLQTISSASSDETVEVPDILNSSESLEFCGFTIEVANMLYDRWRADQEELQEGELGYGADIINLAREYISGMAGFHDAFNLTDDWESALDAQGMKETTRQRILDPEFEYIRLTASAKFWAMDTLNLSWEFLDGLDARVQRFREEKDLRSPSPDPNTKPSRALRQPKALTSRLHNSDRRLRLATEVETPSHVPERCIYYKGGGWTRIISIFNSDGSLNLEDILSQPPSDFHPNSLDLYLTKQREVAEHFASYAGRRVPPQTPTTMTVALPWSFIAQAREVFGEDWKKLIWNSRNKTARTRNRGILPRELAEYERAEVIVGMTCNQSSEQIARMTTPEELKILRTPSGGKASQLALRGVEMLDRFEMECRGFVWVAPVVAPKKAQHFPPV
jgi:hypothetical protein